MPPLYREIIPMLTKEIRADGLALAPLVPSPRGIRPPAVLLNVKQVSPTEYTQ